MGTTAMVQDTPRYALFTNSEWEYTGRESNDFWYEVVKREIKSVKPVEDEFGISCLEFD